MLPFALNHMTAPNALTFAVLDLGKLDMRKSCAAIGLSVEAESLIAFDKAYSGLVGPCQNLRDIKRSHQLWTQALSKKCSSEHCATEVHKMIDPTHSLSASTTFIDQQVVRLAA
jgi:hypothetical protein